MAEPKFVNKARTKSGELHDIHDARIDHIVQSVISGDSNPISSNAVYQALQNISPSGGSVYEFTINGEYPSQEQIQYVWTNKPDKLIIHNDGATIYAEKNSYEEDDSTHGILTYVTTDKHGITILRFRNTSKDGMSFDADFFNFDAGGNTDYASNEQIDEMFPVWADLSGGGSGETHSISWSLSNVNTNYDRHSIEDGEMFQMFLNCDEHYRFDSVAVSMDGVDITNTAWSPEANNTSGDVYVRNVTGDIYVSASAKYNSQENYYTVNIATEHCGTETFHDSYGNAIYDKSTVAEGAGIFGHIDAYDKDGYDGVSVTVTMGGTDITATAWDSDKKDITIYNVTGGVNIFAVGTKSSGETYTLSLNFTNVGNWSIEDDNENSLYNGSPLPTVGYISGEIYPSGGNDELEVTITMDGVDISYVWQSNHNEFEIKDINGNIVITARGYSSSGTSYQVHKSSDGNSWVNDIYDENNNIIYDGSYVGSGTVIHGSCGYDTKSGDYSRMRVIINVGSWTAVDTETSDANYDFSVTVDEDTFITVTAISSK